MCPSYPPKLCSELTCCIFVNTAVWCPSLHPQQYFSKFSHRRIAICWKHPILSRERCTPGTYTCTTYMSLHMCICSSVSDGTLFNESVPRTARSEIRCPHDAQRPRGQDLLLVAKDEGFDRVPTKRRDELEWLTDIPHTPTDTSHLGLSAKEPHQMYRYLCGIAH